MNSLYTVGLPSDLIRTTHVDVHAWYGVRYATAERFMPPVPADGQLSVSALEEVPLFPQLPSRLSAAMGSGPKNPQTEEAFYLNIWAPSCASGLPVLFFIHGGAWMTGGGSMSWYNGSQLAARGFVVVNVNYRLGALGHMGCDDVHPLPLPAADLLLALQWVADKVHGHGGDPGKITLVGQSAGGWYAHLLSVLPQTHGMVQRVALLSMGTRSPWSTMQQTEVTTQARQYVGGDLKSAPTHEVLIAGMKALPKEQPRLAYAPSAFLPVASTHVPNALLDPVWAATACHAKQIYIRNTAQECAAFFFNDALQRQASQTQVDDVLGQWPVSELPAILLKDGHFMGAASGLSPYHQLVAAASWRQFEMFPAEYAAQLRKIGKSIQVSRFEITSTLDGFLSGHCLDLPFQFGNFAAWENSPMLAGIDSGSLSVTSDAIISELSKFAH